MLQTFKLIFFCLFQIKILFVRNLEVTMPFDQFSIIVYSLMPKMFIEKIYKFKNYAYIHLDTREHAEMLTRKLEGKLVEK